MLSLPPQLMLDVLSRDVLSSGRVSVCGVRLFIILRCSLISWMLDTCKSSIKQNKPCCQYFVTLFRVRIKYCAVFSTAALYDNNPNFDIKVIPYHSLLCMQQWLIATDVFHGWTTGFNFCLQIIDKILKQRKLELLTIISQNENMTL